MNVKLRYVTHRGKTKLRWYWQRKGHPVTRLPDNVVERVAVAERLNNAADAFAILQPAEPARGTVGWVIARYKAGEGQKGKAKAWGDLAPRSVTYYTRFLQDIDRISAHLPFGEAWTRKNVIDHIETYSSSVARRQCRTVLQNLFSVARYYDLVTVDHTSELRLKSVKPRDRVWADEEVERWIAAAERMDPELVTAFVLLQHTAQRPGDVLYMTWADYKSTGHIRVRQEKTKKLLDVPVHPDLVTRLDALSRTNPRIVTSCGRPLPYRQFNRRFRAVCEATGIDAQARDLRRTAMVNMAIAGATVPMIASVSGHSIDATTRILETYLPRNTRLAEAAIAHLVEFKRRPKSLTR